MDSDWISCKIFKTLTKSTLALPGEEGKIRVKTMGDGQSYISMILDKTHKQEEIPCNQCKAVTRPKNATAKRFTIDFQNYPTYTEIAFLFNKTDDLKRCFDAIAAIVGEAATKKATKCLSKPVQAPVYPSQKISNGVNAASQKYASTLTTTPRRTTTSAPLSESIQQTRINTRQPTSLHATQPGSSAEPELFMQQSKNTDLSISRKRNHRTQEDDDNPYGYISKNEENALSTDTKKQKRIDDDCDIGSPPKEFGPENVRPTSSWNLKTTTPRRNSKFDDFNNIKEDNAVVNKFMSPGLRNNYTNLSSYDIYRHRCMANLGNSCYMNASLQALASLPQFITELIKAVPEENYRIDSQPKRSAILRAVVNVFDHLFGFPEDKLSKENGSICPREVDGPVPRELLKAVREAAGSQIDRSMGESTQHDAQEFLSRLLEIIEEEIGSKKTIEEERPTSDKENYSAEDLTILSAKQKIDENSAVLSSFTHILPKPRPAINPGSLFKITCSNRLVCNDCGYISRKVETDREVQLGMGNNEPSITDLIRMQFERHDVSWKCTKCESTRASMSTSFNELPEYLIIVLKRYGYDEDTGGNKSTKTVKVDRDLYLQMLCEGSDLKKKELEKTPQPPEVHPENKNENDAEVVPESPEAASSLQTRHRGFKSPVKSVSRELFPKSTFDEAGSNDSQRSKSIFGDDEEIDKETSVKVEHEFDSDLTPEPSKETVPSSPGAIADKLADSNVFSKSSDDEPYDNVDSLRQSGGAVIDIQNNSRSSKKVRLESCDSEDSAIIVEEKKSDSILWKPLTPKKIRECIQNIDSDLSSSTVATIAKWKNTTLDNQQRTIPMSLPRGAFKLSRVEGDGACLFRCFSWWLFEGSQEHHDILRSKICDFIQQFHHEFSALAKSNWSGFDDAETYLRFMRQHNEWGSHLEISAMATLLRCTIYSYHKKAWRKFPPKFVYITKPTKKGDEYEKAEGETKDETASNGAMYIYNYKSHFDPVCGIDEKAPDDDPKDTEQEDSMDVDFNINNCLTPPPQVSDHEEEKTDIIEDKQQGPYIYNESDGPVYTLSAVVNHKGSFLNHGHYTAYSFDADRNTWLNCDDSSVSITSEKVVLTQSKSSGYLFIYRRRHPNDEAQFKCL